MNDSSECAGMKVFSSTKNDLRLPRVNVSDFKNGKSKENVSGRELLINVKNNGIGTRNKNTTPLKESNRISNNTPTSSDGSVKKGMNFQITITPKKDNQSSVKHKTSNLILNDSDIGNNSKKIAFDVSLALKMDEAATNEQNSSLTLNRKTNVLDTTPNMDTPSSIKVAVRMRPLSSSEKQKEGKNNNILIKENQVLIPQKKDIFEFDHCLDSSNPESFGFASQEIVYRKMGKPLLDYAYQGYNVCLIAYGQSGSGKTYTIMGPDDNPGIIPRFLNDLFRNMPPNQDIECIVNISFLEIYNEKIYDLLSDEFDQLSKKLSVREHPQTGPYVEDLKVYTVENYENAMELFKTGLERRSVASTSSNEKSSRSHSIFNIILIQNKKFNEENDQTETATSCISKINLVDLAGSERVGASNMDRFREGTLINKSLLTLGKVITQLAEKNNSHSSHIPYRESLLTYLLKDSLGGNSRTSMIATISPAKCHLEETVSTLRYASITSKIINIVRVNEDQKMKIINGLLKQISFLKKEVNRSKESVSNQDSSVKVALPTACCKNDKKIISSLKEKLKSAVEQQKMNLEKIKTLQSNYSKNLEKYSKNNLNEFRSDAENNANHNKVIDYLKSMVKPPLDVSNFTMEVNIEEKLGSHEEIWETERSKKQEQKDEWNGKEVEKIEKGSKETNTETEMKFDSKSNSDDEAVKKRNEDVKDDDYDDEDVNKKLKNAPSTSAPTEAEPKEIDAFVKDTPNDKKTNKKPLSKKEKRLMKKQLLKSVDKAEDDEDDDDDWTQNSGKKGKKGKRK